MPTRSGRRRSSRYDGLVVRVEFFIEPFAEGRPGPHVLAAVAAAEQRGLTVEFGPFGSSCDVAATEVGAVVAAVVDAAVANGASDVHVTVTAAGSGTE